MWREVAQSAQDCCDDPGQVAQACHLAGPEFRSARTAQHNSGVHIAQGRSGQRRVHVAPHLRHPLRGGIERLRAIGSPKVKEVRGAGLWIGVELRKSAGGARRYCEELQRGGMVCKETHTHTIRFAPPLVIERADLEWALERIENVLE